MLSVADAELVARDPALPGLPLLLDSDAFAAALRATLPAADVGAARATYVRYKRGTSCLVAYRLQIDGDEIDVYAKAYRRGDGAKIGKARERLSGEGPLGPAGFVLDEAAVTVQAFPHDHELRVLSRLADESARPQLLAKLVPDRPDLHCSALRTLRYKPERRYVAQLVTKEGEGAVIRVYTKSDFDAASRRAKKAFKSRGPLRVARRLGRSIRHRMVVLEWLPGRPLDEAARDPAFQLSAASAAGAALAELHAQGRAGLMCSDRRAEADALVASVAAVAELCPDLAERARDLASRVAAGLLRGRFSKRPIHGDFSADQVVLTEDGTGILDLDRAVLGDPAADLGSFIAQLERDALAGVLPTGRAEGMRDALLDGYGKESRHAAPERIRLFTVARLLRLAPEPFRRREADWPKRTEAILERAEEIDARG